MTIESYMREVCNRPTLSDEEEAELIRRYQEVADLNARAKIIEANLRLVAIVARGYTKDRSTLADLVQEGTIGLFKALDTFDAQRGCKFSTYAIYFVRSEMVRFLVENANKAIPDDDETQAVLLREKIDHETQSAEQRPDSLVESCQTNHVKDRVRELLAYFEQTLSEREREIFRSLWRTEKRSPLQELSRQHGISRTRITQIDGQILQRLRRFLHERMGKTLAAC